MNGLVFILLKVEVVANGMITALIDGVENNLHIEFPPTLLGD